jgi:hypothetical protein
MPHANILRPLNMKLDILFDDLAWLIVSDTPARKIITLAFTLAIHHQNP